MRMHGMRTTARQVAGCVYAQHAHVVFPQTHSERPTRATLMWSIQDVRTTAAGRSDPCLHGAARRAATCVNPTSCCDLVHEACRRVSAQDQDQRCYKIRLGV